jgi:hypothetical protein
MRMVVPTSGNAIVDPLGAMHAAALLREQHPNMAPQNRYKFNTGKLPLPGLPTQFIQSCLSANHFESIAIDLPHVLQINTVPDHHKRSVRSHPHRAGSSRKHPDFDGGSADCSVSRANHWVATEGLPKTHTSNDLNTDFTHP